MNKIKMYSFYDKKAERFDTPFFVFDQVGAERHFIMSFQKVGTLMNTFKDDYELHYIGDFTIENASFEKTKGSTLVLAGKEVSLNQNNEKE